MKRVLAQLLPSKRPGSLLGSHSGGQLLGQLLDRHINKVPCGLASAWSYTQQRLDRVLQYAPLTIPVHGDEPKPRIKLAGCGRVRKVLVAALGGCKRCKALLERILLVAS